VPTAHAEYRPLAGHEFDLEGLDGDATVFQPIQRSHVWEPHVMALLERIVQPDFVCLDVGANIGAITLPLARLASKGRVYAFEAAPATFDLLKRNIAGNALDNVTAEHAAITARSGDTVEIFTIGDQLGWGHQANSESGRTGTP
jgi:protein-L-isoaspartate O-methyltransferase